MRYLRLLLGLGIIGFALWVIVGEQMSGASADAFVNARLTTVRAPDAGVLTIPDRALGSAVRQGEELGTISDPLVDDVRLADLRMEEAFAQAELAAFERRITAIDDGAEGLRARIATYSAARVSELEARLAEARNRLSALEDGGTDTELTQLGAGTEAGEGAGDPRLPALALAYARERVATLEIALDVARRGVFLGDGYNDAPYAEQRRAEIETLRAGYLVDRDLAAARLSAVQARLSHETLRTNTLRGGPLVAPASGLLWEMLAADGEVVQRGQDIVRLADCDSAVVSLSVTESVYNRLSVGDAATFRLSGTGESHPATILRLAGSGARTIYQNLAVAPSQKHLERFDVTLLVPALRSEPGLRCLIGRTGRVFFDRRPLDPFRALWN